MRTKVWTPPVFHTLDICDLEQAQNGGQDSRQHLGGLVEAQDHRVEQTQQNSSYAHTPTGSRKAKLDQCKHSLFPDLRTFVLYSGTQASGF